MALKLMYITNQPEVALIAEQAGVDFIFIDMEFIGKKKRQGGMDTVQLHHTVDDIRNVRSVIKKAKLMVRINPMHEAGEEDGCVFTDSRQEIEDVIAAGADIIMLPYFKTVEEVKDFVRYVDGRATIFPLLETVGAVEHIDEILNIPEIDQIHVGINDLSIDKKSGFMFNLLADGTIDAIAAKCRAHHMPFGFGGIASPHCGLVPAEYIIGEHYRLRSEFAILSRSFCDTRKITDLDEIRSIFENGVKEIRSLEERLRIWQENGDDASFLANREKAVECIANVQKMLVGKEKKS